MIYQISLLIIYIIVGISVGGMAITAIVSVIYMISLLMADRKPIHYVQESPLSSKGYIIARRKK